jgi:N-acetyl-anhydromuramyl-L-alanine amidase AmpD
MTDYPGAKDFSLPTNYSFSSNAHVAIVIHKTAGDASLEGLYNTFNTSMRSTHYGINLYGDVGQFVSEARGAGGNCCLEAGHNAFWDSLYNQYGNLNLCTLSIEHIDPSSDNSYIMPQAQVDASHRLVQYLCHKYNIGIDHIHSHASLDPESKARCPGPTYDFQALFNYIQAPTQQHTDTSLKQAQDVWKSSGSRVGTGIYEAWLKLFKTLNLGEPIRNEYQTVDWDGNVIAYQSFSGGYHIEWRDGKSYVHQGNKLVYTL